MKSVVKVSVLLALAAVSSIANAAEVEFFPVLTTDDYEANFGLAVVYGSLSPDGDSAVAVAGAELSFSCPVLRVPGLGIRQQLSFTQGEKNDVEFTSVELAPHYMIGLAPKLIMGVGPTISFTKMDVGVVDDSVVGIGIGASVRYDINESLYVGADVRSVWGSDYELVDDITVSSQNTRGTVKLGYQF